MIRILFLIVALALQLRGAESNADFESANRLYEKGDFAAALAAYRKIASGGQASAALWFNLGNAAFKNGRPGEAIAAYRRAGALAPRDPDIRANLRFARESVPGNTTRSGAVDRLMRILSAREAGVLATILVWSWFGLLGAAQVQPKWRIPLKMWQVAAGTLAVVFVAYYWAIHFYQRANRTAVVVAPGTASVRYGPLEESQTSYSVRDGNELRVVGRKDAWLQVTDASGRVGWMPARDLEEVPF